MGDGMLASTRQVLVVELVHHVHLLHGRADQRPGQAWRGAEEDDSEVFHPPFPGENRGWGKP